MAPEILYNKEYNQCIDYWSFGILVYEMVTGKTPFWAPTTY
jgi:serine/threonine protein kinase